jgi:GntR family transcriptional regulator, transcriptional repressor for pyruvate dehydrogenase complex
MRKLDEINQDALTDQVIRKIQDLIWRGEVLPGEYLPPQHELAEQFGVGLSTIREAVKALSLIKLVDTRAGRGTRVLPDSLKILNNITLMKANLGTVEADQVLEARLTIEGALTRLAAERATDEDILEIEAAVDEMTASLEDSAAFVRADMRFHLAVARASKNDVLMQTYHLIRSLLEEVVRQADELPGGKERALANHNQILAGIKQHDPQHAMAASERQITDAMEYRENNTGG